MTVIVGILCDDGLVIGTDSSATFAAGVQPTIEQPTEKLTIVGDSVIVAGTGQIGLGQRFVRIVENAAANTKLFGGKTHHIDVGKTLCHQGLQDFGQTFMKPGQYAALVGFPCNDKPCLCEFAIMDFQPEFKTEKLWYCSMGSGQHIADPFLALVREVFWGDRLPTVQDATFAVTWTLDHAIKINPGGINAPARIAVMEKVGGNFRARILKDADLQEHIQNIEQAKKLLRDFANSQGPHAPEPPDIPRPTPDIAGPAPGTG